MGLMAAYVVASTGHRINVMKNLTVEEVNGAQIRDNTAVIYVSVEL